MRTIENTITGNFEQKVELTPIELLSNKFIRFDCKSFSDILAETAKEPTSRILEITQINKSPNHALIDHVREQYPNISYSIFDGKVSKTTLKGPIFNIAFVEDAVLATDSIKKISFANKLLKDGGYLYASKLIVDNEQLEEFQEEIRGTQFKDNYRDSFYWDNSNLTKRGFCLMDFALRKDAGDNQSFDGFSKMLAKSQKRYAQEVSLVKGFLDSYSK